MRERGTAMVARAIGDACRRPTAVRSLRHEVETPAGGEQFLPTALVHMRYSSRFQRGGIDLHRVAFGNFLMSATNT